MLPLCEFQKELLSLLEAILDRLYRLLGKELVLDDELVQIVTQEIGTNVAPMAVIDAEKGAFWPLGTAILLRFGFHDVEDDSDAVLVVVAHDALVRIGSVGGHDAVAFGGEFG